MQSTQQDIDSKNAEFWSCLCGTGLMQTLKHTSVTPESLADFDYNYLSFYPYLTRYLDLDNLKGKRVLEVGLGYGTVSQKIAEVADYTGLDISSKPVEMANYRLQLNNLKGRAVVGSVLQMPFKDSTFHRVIAIGCFHHTGDMQKAVDEAYRVLVPGGQALIMVYNKFSLRNWMRWPKQTLSQLISDFRGRGDSSGDYSHRHAFDHNTSGDAAPHTDFFSSLDIKKIFKKFSEIKISKENCDPIVFYPRVFRGRMLQRERLLGTVGKIGGLDLYITARK